MTDEAKQDEGWVSTTVRLRPAKMAQVDAVAKARDVSRQKLLADWIERGLRDAARPR
jgi:hypothetical protein